jgi:CHASE2 domain-containing sensor protein
LGLAHDLADLHIGQVIVMRESVPDLVAQEFLRHFLAAFSGGESLYASVREARERLQGLEGEYPCATWLPVICQNPAEAPTSWQELSGVEKCDSATGRANQQNRQILPSTRRFKTVLVASVVVTALVMGVRQLGMLQTWELQAYDQLMRLRPDEGPDSRLLVVAIKDEDLQLPEQKQRRKGTSLSDLALARLLEKLEAYQPRAIGLDIFRDFPADPKQVDLTRLQQSEAQGASFASRFFAVCNVGEPGGKDRGISPPPDIPTERLGFSNILPDSDGIVRRHLLSMDARPPSRCTTSKALSFQLALRYLKAEGITDKVIKGNWQLGKVVFKRLQAPAGGYQKADTWGNQVLLNYRSYRSPLEIADIVTLTDVLKNEVRLEDVKDRVVLIGVMTRTSRDRFLTPYSAGQSPKQEMPGVILHAQMVSQILRAVLNGRPLLWVWPQWGEVLWVWGWSFVGGILAWRFRSPQALGLAIGVTLGVLYGMNFGLITQGGWAPLVPSALALVATGGSVLAKRRVSALPTSGFRSSDSS